MLRTLSTVLAVALLAVPAAALAKGGAGKSQSEEHSEQAEHAQKAEHGKGKTSYVLKGTLSGFKPATATENGSISITVSKGNKGPRLRALNGSTLTFAVTRETRVRFDDDGAITDGELGMVKLKGAHRLDAAGLQQLPARQVVDREDD